MTQCRRTRRFDTSLIGTTATCRQQCDLKESRGLSTSTTTSSSPERVSHTAAVVTCTRTRNGFYSSCQRRMTGYIPGRRALSLPLCWCKNRGLRRGHVHPTFDSRRFSDCFSSGEFPGVIGIDRSSMKMATSLHLFQSVRLLTCWNLPTVSAVSILTV